MSYVTWNPVSKQPTVWKDTFTDTWKKVKHEREQEKPLYKGGFYREFEPKDPVFFDQRGTRKGCTNRRS